jgi:hypothetical protein
LVFVFCFDFVFYLQLPKTSPTPLTKKRYNWDSENWWGFSLLHRYRIAWVEGKGFVLHGGLKGLFEGRLSVAWTSAKVCDVYAFTGNNHTHYTKHTNQHRKSHSLTRSLPGLVHT